MKQQLFFIVSLVSLLLGFLSCNKDSNNSIEVKDEITIYGNVIDRNTGQPLYNVLIEEKNKVGGSTVTGNDGNYVFTLPLNGSSDGKYYLVASKNKYTTSEYELNLNNVDRSPNVKVDFQLSQNCITYTGLVVDVNNVPIVGAQIQETNYYKGTTTTTDIDGKFKLELPQYFDYDNWVYIITASKDNYVSESIRFQHSVDDLGYSFTANFTLTSSFVTITGRVTDNSGNPVKDAIVYDMIYGIVSYETKSTATTNNNGEYTLLSTVYYQSGEKHYYKPSKDGYKYDNRSYELYLGQSDEGKTYNHIDFKLTKQ